MKDIKIFYLVEHYTIKTNIIKSFFITKLYGFETLSKIWLCSCAKITTPFTLKSGLIFELQHNDTFDNIYVILFLVT